MRHTATKSRRPFVASADFNDPSAAPKSRRRRKRAAPALGLLLSVLAVLLAASPAVAAEANFDYLSLAPESHWNGPDPSGTNEPDPVMGGTRRVGSFTSGNVDFVNRYNLNFGSWSGFAYSNVTDNTTPGYTNQFSAITGSGHGAGDDNYAIGFGYVDSLDPSDPNQLAELPYFELPESGSVESAYFTNTTYAALSMLSGDAFAKKFGGTTGDDPDWFLLTAYGTDAAGTLLEDGGGDPLAVDFYLADYRFADNGQDYIVDEWTYVDLSLLADAQRLYFNLSSSDVGTWGMNTPSFFALDQLEFAFDPEPDAWIDLVYDAIDRGDTDPQYDIDGDGGAADQDDMDELVEVVYDTRYGDAQLDGDVDLDDGFKLVTHWQTTDVGWADGDFNGDGTVNLDDGFNLVENWGWSRGGSGLVGEAPTASAVPEPGTLGLFGCAALMLLLLRRHRRRH